MWSLIHQTTTVYPPSTHSPCAINSFHPFAPSSKGTPSLHARGTAMDVDEDEDESYYLEKSVDKKFLLTTQQGKSLNSYTNILQYYIK
jgi:hypothetical protein